MNEKRHSDFIKETAGDRLYTYGDYLNWKDEQRYELIDGQVYLLSPAPSRRHQEILIELIRQISMYLFDKDCKVYAAPFDVRLPEREERDEDIKTIVQPDILLVCDDNKLDERGCRGVPDLIIEIISPSSGARDRKDKRNLYERHGVKEYWLVDYTENTVEVYLLNNQQQYGKPEVYTGDEVILVSLFNDLKVDLKLVFRE